MPHALGGRDSEGLPWRTGGNGAEKLTKIPGSRPTEWGIKTWRAVYEINGKWRQKTNEQREKIQVL